MSFSLKQVQAITLAVLVLGVSGVFQAMPVLQSAIAEQASAVKTVKLPAGSAVILRLLETINSNEVTAGQQITSQVVQDVKVDNAIVIKAGSIALATVSKVNKNGIVGQGGELVISDFYATSVDGSRVPLMANLSQEGKDKMPLAIVGGLICLPLIFIKGGKAIIPAGTQKTVYTAVDVTVSL
jgi:hypothetical protein